MGNCGSGDGRPGQHRQQYPAIPPPVPSHAAAYPNGYPPMNQARPPQQYGGHQQQHLPIAPIVQQQRPPPPQAPPLQRRPSLTGMSPAPGVQDTQTIQNSVNLKRETVKFADGNSLTFDMDCSRDCSVAVYTMCEEKGEKEGKITFFSQQRAGAGANASRGMRPVWTSKFETGTGIKVTTGALDVSSWPIEGLSPSADMRRWPLVVALQCEPPTCQENPTGKPQLQYNYMSIDGAQRQTPTVKLQKLQIGSDVYELEPIYGAVAEAADTASQDGGGIAEVGALVAEVDESETTCVVCLTEQRDTLVMPCRHMCLCSGCAESVSKQGTCPICRTRIQGLLKAGARSPIPS
eukprot:Hpha_TRINITY_DN14145_c1_g2::TRINITY_DN14145_c1_g2_i1::g.11089::m.11089